MRNIKRLLLFITVVSILLLVFSGCRKEKITRWRCVPYEGCLIEISVDNAADLAHVTVDYAEGYAPNPCILFHHNTTYKIIEEALRRINPATSAFDSPGFIITFQSYGYMNLVAVDYREDDYDDTPYITLYYFTRVF
ncbi:MAG: hypothetical protein II899_11320 [Bacteroidales bacterium]|nr:hypothetical protein [Bacteroidales bacterium]